MLYCNFYICLIYFILSYVEAAADEPTEGGKCTALSTVNPVIWIMWKYT
jgi:hypothetical protein